jgi:hypothetical protein
MHVLCNLAQHTVSASIGALPRRNSRDGAWATFVLSGLGYSALAGRRGDGCTWGGVGAMKSHGGIGNSVDMFEEEEGWA